MQGSLEAAFPPWVYKLASHPTHSVIALLRDVPDLQDFDGFAADAIRQQGIAMQHQFTGAFEITAPADEGVLGQVFGGVPETRRQRARRLRVVFTDEIQYLLQVGERGTRPFKFHSA